MSKIQDASQADVAALGKALIQANLAVQPFVQGDPCSPDVGDATDAVCETCSAALSAVGYGALASNEAIVTDGQVLDLGTGTVTFAVTDGVLSGTYLAD